jgi:hypothetical protein
MEVKMTVEIIIISLLSLIIILLARISGLELDLRIERDSKEFWHRAYLEKIGRKK